MRLELEVGVGDGRAPFGDDGSNATKVPTGRWFQIAATAHLSDQWDDGSNGTMVPMGRWF